MAKISIKFTMPSDVDADRVGLVVAASSAQAVTDANAGNFLYIQDGLSPDQTITLDVFEINDGSNGTDLTAGVTYFLVPIPGDEVNNFAIGHDSDDVVSGVAQAILDTIPSKGDFEATLKALLNADASLLSLSSLAKITATDRAIFPRAHFPVGSQFPQITYEFEEGESEDALPAARRVLRVKYWIKERAPQGYKKMKTTMDRVNELVNRTAGTFTSVDVVANTGLRVAAIVKTGGGQDWDDTVKKQFWENIYDVVISEEESYAVADAGNKTWE